MNTHIRSMLLLVILSVSAPSLSYNYAHTFFELTNKSLIIACTLSCWCIQSVSAQNDASIITDLWTYDNTNAQSILGAIGLASLSLNVIAGYYYYKKTQKDLANELRPRKNELEERNAHDKQILRAVYGLKEYMEKKSEEKRDSIVDIPN
jgi:hypothetical protein